MMRILTGDEMGGVGSYILPSLLPDYLTYVGDCRRRNYVRCASS